MSEAKLLVKNTMRYADYPDAVASVQNELIQKLTAKGHTVEKTDSHSFRVDGEHIYLEFKFLDRGNMRWGGADNSEVLGKLQLTLNRYHSSLRRQMKKDGGFPIDEFVERISQSVAGAKAAQERSKLHAEAKAATIQLLKDLGLTVDCSRAYIPSDAGQSQVEVHDMGNATITFSVGSGDPEKLRKVVEFAKGLKYDN